MGEPVTFIPTANLRLAASPRTDINPPRLQQLWIRVVPGQAETELHEVANRWPNDVDGEWRDVPIVVVP